MVEVLLIRENEKTTKLSCEMEWYQLILGLCNNAASTEKAIRRCIQKFPD